MNTPVRTRVDVPAGKGIVSMGLCFNKKHPLSRCHFDGGERTRQDLIAHSR